MLLNKEFLPIGSVVGLKNDSRRLMIIGRKLYSENHHVIRDYASIDYPNGFIDAGEKFLLFNNDEIDVVYHYGYVDEMEVQLNRLLKESEAEVLKAGEGGKTDGQI